MDFSRGGEYQLNESSTNVLTSYVGYVNLRPMSANKDEEIWHSTPAIAKRLGVDRRTIARWIPMYFPNARRKSPRPGSPHLISESDIIAFEKLRDGHKKDA